MNTIDQRILIPTPPDVVWDYISDISQNTKWQVDCKAVTFLTSKRSGPGTRWRMSTDKGREQVLEITAWYDGLGYQYTYIDGAPFKQSMGRIRLQEIPEGTVVQWTIQYEMGGLLGGVRGSMGTAKQIETAMIASLKALWKQVNTSGAAQNWREAKSLMRDAPDAEARATYKPRHPTVADIKGEEQPIADATSPGLPVIPEPPVTEEDTRPRPAVAFMPPRQTIHEMVEDTEEPEFLSDMSRFAPPPDFGSDTQPVRAITRDEEEAALAERIPTSLPPSIMSDEELDAFLAPSAPTQPAIPEVAVRSTDELLSEFELEGTLPEIVMEDAPEPPAAEPTIAEFAPQDEPVTEADPEPALAYDAEQIEEAREIAADEQPATQAAATHDSQPLEPVIDPTVDTSQVSIWDVFGLPRPSETQEMRAAQAAEIEAPLEPAPTPAAEAEISDEVIAHEQVAETALDTPEPVVTGIVAVDLTNDALSPHRVGLRVKLRRKHVLLRRPE